MLSLSDTLILRLRFHFNPYCHYCLLLPRKLDGRKVVPDRSERALLFQVYPELISCCVFSSKAASDGRTESREIIVAMPFMFNAYQP